MDVSVKTKPPDKDSIKMIPDDRSGVQTRSSVMSSKNSGNSSSNLYPSRVSSTSRGGLNSQYTPTKDSNLQRGLSRSMDVIINPTARDNGSVHSADTNNNSKRLETFRRKFSCPEIAAILDQYIPKEELGDPQPTAMPSPMRRSRSLNELPGSHRVPILKRTEPDRMKARLEASIAGTEELNKLRENQEKLMAETRSSANTRKHQNRRQSNPTRLSSSQLTRIFEEENGHEDSDQEVFYENQGNEGKYKDARSPRRTQSYRESNAYRRYSDNSDVPRTLNDSAQSWSELTQKAESLSDTPAKRNIRSNSMFVGNSTSGKSPSLLSHAEQSPTSGIDSKLRRSSMQSDAILTGWNRSNKSASIFENMDIKSTSPNPIRAVLMQYEVSKRTVPLNLKRSPTKSSPMKAFRNDPKDLTVSGTVLASDTSSDTTSNSQSENGSKRSSGSPSSSDQKIKIDKRMEHVARESDAIKSGIDHQPNVNPRIPNTNDCDKPDPRQCGPHKQNHPNLRAVNNRADSPKPKFFDPKRDNSAVESNEKTLPPSSSTPVGTPKHIKYNSIASDDSLLTPSSYRSFCSSNLSSASFNSTARLPCVSIDEGFIESPPLSPDHTQSFYSFHENPDDKHSKMYASDTSVALKASDKVVQKQKIKEIPSNSRTQTEV